MRDEWDHGAAYDQFMGRWSALVAGEFLDWVDVPAARRWLDVGAGTGALSATIAMSRSPASVASIEPSSAFVEVARRRLGPAADVRVGDAVALPFSSGHFDAVVSGLVLNFVADPLAAVMEALRVTTPGGVVAAYVWDYAHGLAMLRHFWDAAVELDPGAAGLDEAARFAICTKEALRVLWTAAGLSDIVLCSLAIRMRFESAEAFWRPFLGGAGPAPSYVASLPDARRDALRDRVVSRLPVLRDGSVTLAARAIAVSGRAPQGETPH